MNDDAYRDADREAANLGRKRKKLAHWWRPLVSTFVAGSLAFITLLCGEEIGVIDVESLYPWGVMLIVSALCIAGPFVPLFIMIPLDVYWDQRMRRAFQRRRLAVKTISQQPKG
ncbi:MAG: hypothetical protein ACK46Q_03350 [Hyphomonas sp.]